MTDERRRGPNEADGLLCPRCGCPQSEVVWIRHRKFTTPAGDVINKTIRRRECVHCLARFNTTERRG